MTAYQIGGGKVSARDQAAIEDAYEAGATVCADPSKASTIDAVTFVFAETAIIARIIKKKE